MYHFYERVSVNVICMCLLRVCLCVSYFFFFVCYLVCFFFFCHKIRKLREVVTESVDGPTQLQQHSPTAPAIGLNRSSSTIVAIQASAFTPSAAPHRRLSLPTAQPPQRKEQGHQREQQQQRQNQLKPSPSFRRNSGSGGGGGGGQSQQKRRLPPQQLPQDI